MESDGEGGESGRGKRRRRVPNSRYEGFEMDEDAFLADEDDGLGDEDEMAELAGVFDEESESLSEEDEPRARERRPRAQRPADGAGAKTAPLEWSREYPTTHVRHPFDDAPVLQRVAGIVRDVVAHGAEVDILRALLPDALLLPIIETTNAYVVALQADDQERPYLRDGLQWPPRWVADWYDLDMAEFHVWLGISLLTGQLDFPTRRNLWTRSWPFNAPMDNVMSRARYEAIRAALHFVPELRTPEGKGTLYKVEPILESFQKRFRHVYRPGASVAGDEAMIRVESRWAPPAASYQKMPKPIGHGFVLDVIAEAKQDEGV